MRAVCSMTRRCGVQRGEEAHESAVEGLEKVVAAKEVEVVEERVR